MNTDSKNTICVELKVAESILLVNDKEEIGNDVSEQDFCPSAIAFEKLNIVEPLETNKQQPKVMDVPSQIQASRQLVFSEDPTFVQQLQGTQELRKLLSIERDPPIQLVIDAGVVPYFVRFMQLVDQPHLQYQAAWAMTNIASGTIEHTRVVMDAGAVPIFIQLLSSANDDVCEQAAWALGNVAAYSVPCRDMVLSLGALPALLQVAEGLRTVY